MIHSDPLPRGRLAGRTVARIGYGAMQLERLASGSPDDRAAGIAVLRRAVELGVDHIDTAGFYGDAVVNRLIREALAPYPAGLTIVSKVGARHAAGSRPPLVAAQRPDELRAAVHEDLASLGVERIDVVNLRRIERPPGIVATGDQVVDLDDQLDALVGMRDEGLIGAIGLSNVSIDDLRRAEPVGISCVQNRYSLVDRADEALRERCAALGIAWVPFFPLGGAFPGSPKVTDQAAVRRAAQALDATTAQVGLAWLLAHDGSTLLIPGTSSLDHLAENLAAGSLTLPADTLAELDAVAGDAE